MVAPLAILLIVAVVGLIAWGYSENEGFTATANSLVGTAQTFADNTFKLHEDCTQDGSCVAFFANKEPEQHQDMDAGYDIGNVQEATYYENGTEVSQFSYATGVVTDTSYTKTGSKLTESLVGDDGQMIVQIGNIATIQGQIKILNNNNDIIEPRLYHYYLMIRCDDSTEFCNLDPISRRGTTTTSGTFIEKWTTNFKNTAGLYQVDIFATADAVNEFNQKYETKGTLYVELYK